MADIHRRKVDKDPHGFTHLALDKATNEPILGLAKSDWGNEYSWRVHPDFKQAHGHVMLPHELNKKGSYTKPGDVDGHARTMHNAAYMKYYNKGNPHAATYKYSHSTDVGNEPTHVYHMHDAEGDKMFSFHTEHPPETLPANAQIKKITALNTDKYDENTHLLPAKVKHSTGYIESLMNVAQEMHKNKDKKAPRFIGHEHKGGGTHKSFKTSLQAPHAINAYVEHLKKEKLSDEHRITSQSDRHATIEDGKQMHFITHDDTGHIHHMSAGSGWKEPGKNTEIIEQYAK